MNDCGLVDCQWAGRLRVVACLSHLYLAHNKIDDYGLQILAGGLEACGCIRYLDLSYNAFTGSLSSGGLGDLIKNSKVLTTLIVAGNIMPMSTWTMVSAGLLENTSLQVRTLPSCHDPSRDLI
jgi:Ran GTPase-activating protein (RanGAP) involved in mRNA processing and transport